MDGVLIFCFSTEDTAFKAIPHGAGEMVAQQLRILTALPEDPGSISNTHKAAHNICNSRSDTLTQTYTNAYKIKI